MALSTTRWHVIAESRTPWEKEALDYLRERLPDREPVRVWSNFEFIADDGSINEVDALVLTAAGFYLVEIKSRPGVIEGDAHTWSWHDAGRIVTDDNPLLLANLKAKRLKSLLRRQRAFQRGRVPFLDPLIFCSAPDQRLRLQGAAALRVHLRDELSPHARADQPGIVDVLTADRVVATDQGSAPARIDLQTARAITQAIEQAGIRPANRTRRVGDYLLETLLAEGPAWQDWAATHVSLANLKRRVRLYRVPLGAPAELRQTIRRAAEREFQILQGINHPGILKALDFREDERGPALVFDHDPSARRLDLYMREQGATLSVADRLRLLREIAEIVRAAHEKRLVHRALSPQTVLVSALPNTLLPSRVQIFGWQTGGRDGSTTGGGAVSATAHPDVLVEDATTVFMAPESHLGADTGEHLDVFSLGALAWFLFTGQPPADSLLSLTERLREGHGLRLSSAINGAGRQLEELVQFATAPSVAGRLDSVADFLEYLDLAERELLPEQIEPAIEPTEARAGDELPGGYKVVRRLGKGSTAVALLVLREGRELVLKVALTPEQNDRLQAEADTLRQLRHQHIVELHGELEIAGRKVLVLDLAGDKTLAERLRAEGRLHVELLSRLGEDLLQTVDWLEAKGIPHRDIKPDNLGVSPIGEGDRLELVLFDFSLSRTPADQIRAGTPPYLEPFLSLRRPARWDFHAERFASSVTLYEMAAGTVPRWGDGQSDPAVIDDEVTIDGELFDATLREPLTEFFRQALRRNPDERFHTAEEMLRAWRRVFESAEKAVDTGDGAEDGSARLEALLSAATLETSIAALGLGTRALNALDRLNVITVSDLLSTPTTNVWGMRGVGHKTRREIGELVKRLQERFPQAPVVPRPAVPDTGEAVASAPAAHSLDLIVPHLVPRRAGAKGAEERVLRLLLGLEQPHAPHETGGAWPTQTDVAREIGMSRARVSQLVARARSRWLKDPSVTGLRTTIAAELERNGSVLTAGEVAEMLLLRRGSVHVEPTRSVHALAAGRAAVEAEQALGEPRFYLRRNGSVTFCAVNDAWANYADRLGQMVDRLLASDVVVSPQRAMEVLGAYDPPDGEKPLTPARLMTLAAAASLTGAVSANRLELYRKGIDAARAIKLASSALVGVDQLTVEAIGERVRSRYPEAQPLPERPALDALLEEAGLALRWTPEAAGGQGAYCGTRGRSSTSAPTSTLTSLAAPRRGEGPVSAEEAEAKTFDERLRYLSRHGGFVALAVAPRYARPAAERLASEYGVERVSVDDRLIATMREEAAEAGADWRTVIETDAAGPGSPDWPLLVTLVKAAVERLERSLARPDGTLLLEHAGLLARYGQLGLLERLRDRAGRRDSELHGAWVLVPSGQMPAVDGQAIPVITPGQWAAVPDLWVRQNAS